jgi:hypothetical protein
MNGELVPSSYVGASRQLASSVNSDSTSGPLNHFTIRAGTVYHAYML